MFLPQKRSRFPRMRDSSSGLLFARDRMHFLTEHRNVDDIRGNGRLPIKRMIGVGSENTNEHDGVQLFASVEFIYSAFIYNRRVKIYF